VRAAVQRQQNNAPPAAQPPEFVYFQGERLAPGERQQGVMLNEVDFTYGRSTHIPNAHMANDTQLVVAQGRAYQGRTVAIRTNWGQKTWQNAAIVYLKRQSGANGRDRFLVKGYDGEQVRIYSVRFQDLTPPQATDIHAHLVAGEGGFPDGDPYWRNVALPIVRSPENGDAARGERFIHDQPDPYGGAAPGYRSNFLHDTGAAFTARH
jgi:hypothetical protein